MSYLIIEIVDKYMVTYYHPKPTFINHELFIGCVKTLRLAPVLLMANSYWMLTNKQYFDDKVEMIDLISDQMLVQHTLHNSISYENQSVPFNYYFFILSVMYVLKLIWKDKV